MSKLIELRLSLRENQGQLSSPLVEFAIDDPLNEQHVQRLLRTFGRQPIRKLLFPCLPEFVPNLFEDIVGTFPRLREIWLLTGRQLRPWKEKLVRRNVCI
jgi:hypothetical protein